MKTIIENNTIKVQSDYNKDFIARARMLQGKWKAPYWCFPEENKDELRELLLDVYGECDTLAEESTAYVTLEVSLDELSDGESIRLDTMTLCRRQHRDYDVRLSDNVMLIKGGFPFSGGSMKNPRCCPQDGTVLRVKNVPMKIYERVREHEGVTLVGDIDRAKLVEERERLMARLAELDELLAAI